ncbi:unnamed protein product [Closterium sp. Naga37s-1]|nr:unnamed protein product [Closterium sp. Naga37s-1]
MPFIFPPPIHSLTPSHPPSLPPSLPPYLPPSPPSLPPSLPSLPPLPPSLPHLTHRAHGTPISLHLTAAQPQWTTSVRWLLSRSPAPPSLCLSFSHPSLIPLIRRSFTLPSSPTASSLSSLQLSLGVRDKFTEEDYRLRNWNLGFLKTCFSLHSLTLGPLAAISPQLHEFSFCEPWKLEEEGGEDCKGPVLLALEFHRARRLSFHFLSHELKLKLALSHDSLTSFSACAQSLTLACSSARPLTLT